MNRPIKFRSWNFGIDINKPEEGFRKIMNYHPTNMELQVKFDDYDKHMQFLNHYFLNTEVPVMQFTGLLDKNNKEIYEGDVLYDACGGHEKYCVVKFDKGAFLVNRSDFDRPRGDGTSELHLWNEFVEVAGNVWENPELKEKCRE